MRIADPPLGFLMHSSGPQLYTGSDKTPTFTLGTFTLNNLDSPGHFKLIISSAVEVPEPPMTALTLAALCLAAIIPARRRRALVDQRIQTAADGLK